MNVFISLCLCCPLSVFSIVVKSAPQNSTEILKAKYFWIFQILWFGRICHLGAICPPGWPPQTQSTLTWKYRFSIFERKQKEKLKTSVCLNFKDLEMKRHLLHICICFLGRQFFSNYVHSSKMSKNLDKEYYVLSFAWRVCCTYPYLYLYIKIGNRVIQIQVSNIRSGTSDFLSRKLVDVYQQFFCLRRNHWMEFLKKVILDIFNGNPQIWDRHHWTHREEFPAS